MNEDTTPRIFRRYLWAALGVVTILILGTLGYLIVGQGKYSWVDCLYMTIITVTTIGYGEIIDMSGDPAGRIFTMFVAVGGISLFTYILMNTTALVVEGKVNEAFRRRRMEKDIGKFRKHYIVCGGEGVGSYIIHELHSTQRPFLLVEKQRSVIDKFLETHNNQLYIEGDSTDNSVLLKAGIEHASGVFAVTNDDNQNLVISLTAKQLNSRVKVVACCNDLQNSEKIKRAGADAVVSPAYIGGLRIASEMVRPTVVTFLDMMLRRDDKHLRIEELNVPQALEGRPLSVLDLNQCRSLLLALKSGNDWIYNPGNQYVMKAGDILVFMATAEDRCQLEEIVSAVSMKD